MKTFILSLPLVVLLAGCNTTGPQVLTKVEFQDRPKFVVTEVSPARQMDVKWIVITKDNFAQKIAEIEKTQGETSFFALTPQGYQNLSVNISELRRYIEQQNATFAAVRRYYETPVNDGKN